MNFNDIDGLASGPRRTIAIVGGSGFLGHAVWRKLERVGYRVVPVPRGSLDRALQGDMQALASLLAGCDAVINCAGRAHVLRREDPSLAERLFMAVNRDLAHIIARAAQDAAVPRLVHVSSVAAIASSSPPGSLIDDASLPAPATIYGRSKLAGDERVLALADEAFRPVVLRPPAVFGPGARGWFPALHAAARRGLPLPLGRIENRRSFSYVGNVADAVAHAIEGQWSGAYIVTDSEPLSSAAFYRLLLEASDKPNRVWPIPAPLASWGARALLGSRAASLIEDAAYDGARFRSASGWKPVYSLADGARHTLAGSDA
jgi:UDP-glucose 4-epimerase